MSSDPRETSRTRLPEHLVTEVRNMSALHEGLTETAPAVRDTEAAPAVSDTEVVPAASGAGAGPVGGDVEAAPAVSGAEAALAGGESHRRRPRHATRGPRREAATTLVLPAISDAPRPAPTPGLAPTPGSAPTPDPAPTPGQPPTPGAEPEPEKSVGSRRYMDVEGTRAPLDDRLADSPFDYQRYATAAGPLARPRWTSPTRFSTGASTTASANGWRPG